MRRNILVVDDDPVTVKMLSFYLDSAGFIVQVQHDGYSALTELYTKPYDLLVLDISMPQMNGFTVLKAIRASSQLKDLPVIIVTGTHDRSDVEKAMHFGVGDFMIKPVHKEDFIGRIERILGGRPQFAEFKLPEGDPLARAEMSYEARIESLSHHGLVLFSPVPLEKNAEVKNVKFALFEKLGVIQPQLKVLDCRPRAEGGFHVFLPFLGLSQDDKQKITEWITTVTLKSRN